MVRERAKGNRFACDEWKASMSAEVPYLIVRIFSKYDSILKNKNTCKSSSCQVSARATFSLEKEKVALLLLRNECSVDTLLAPAPFFLAQHVFLYFAGGGFGQVPELDSGGTFEVGKAFATEGDDV